MNKPIEISLEEAKDIGDSLGIDWKHVDLAQFRMGLAMEHEYVADAFDPGVTSRIASLAGKIALAYLKEYPNYYSRLASGEAEADKQMNNEQDTLDARGFMQSRL